MTDKKTKILVPEVDMACCTMCMGCVEVAPKVFFHNEAGDFIEVLTLEQYPYDQVQEAINICPKNCIIWDEQGT